MTYQRFLNVVGFVSKEKMNSEDLQKLIENSNESEIIDFKENLNMADEIGEYISALGNSALYTQNPSAFLIWGVTDYDHSIIGTTFNPWTAKAKQSKKPKDSSAQMPLITFLETFVDPKLELSFTSHNICDKTIIVLSINVSSATKPIKFHGEEYIRSGSSKTKLNKHPEKERQLWLALESKKFESGIAKENLDFRDVQKLLDINFYVHALSIDGAPNDFIIANLIDDGILVKDNNDNLSITNMGAFAFARRFDLFTNRLAEHAMRITKYDGNAKYTNANYDNKSGKGIILGFENLINTIYSLIPTVENYDSGIRSDKLQFPKIAIRELVANALVHQDFSISGQQPTIDIFDNRIEVTNPGIPVNDVKRLLDLPARSRNNELANLLQKFHIVESRGTGIDKTVYAVEEFEQPAPLFETPKDNTRVTLFDKKKFSSLTTEEKNLIIYWHATLHHTEGDPINNKSLRKRFGVSDRQTASVTRAINNALEAKLIKPYDLKAGTKFMKYVPFWA